MFIGCAERELSFWNNLAADKMGHRIRPGRPASLDKEFGLEPQSDRSDGCT